MHLILIEFKTGKPVESSTLNIWWQRVVKYNFPKIPRTSIIKLIYTIISLDPDWIIFGE